MTESWLRPGRRPGVGALHPENEKSSASIETKGNVGAESAGLSRRLLVGILVVCLLCAPSIGFADSKAAETSRESGLGAAAAVSSLVYGPIKLVYAIGGLVVGGFAWAFTAGDTQVASTVFTRSLRGTYVITPEILLGEERLVFIGRDVDEEPIRTETVAATAPPPATYDESGYDEMGW